VLLNHWVICTTEGAINSTVKIYVPSKNRTHVEIKTALKTHKASSVRNGKKLSRRDEYLNSSRLSSG
jgi:hypothetical protein